MENDGTTINAPDGDPPPFYREEFQKFLACNMRIIGDAGMSGGSLAAEGKVSQGLQGYQASLSKFSL